MTAGYGGCSRRQVFGGSALLAAGLLVNDRAWAKQDDHRHGTVEIDGVNVYYEIHDGPLDGATVPIVLLHGGAVTIEIAFSQELITRFASRQPVIAIEQQGHGHTADRPEKPITIDQMVKDTAGVMAHLKVEQADFFGHSLGGIVATGMAIRHPDVVRSAATLGTPYQLEGFRPDYVRIEHAAEFARLVPNARLAVLPGTTHLRIVKRDAWLMPMIDALMEPSL
jgi:alpha-beta hydrolase superfamily lysophospholipase